MNPEAVPICFVGLALLAFASFCGLACEIYDIKEELRELNQEDK